MNDADLDRYSRAALASKDPDLLVAAHKLATSPYYQFKPRADRPHALDEQSSFVNDQFPGIACIIGGNGSGKTVAADKTARFVRTTPPPDKETRWWVVCQKLAMATGVCWAQHLEGFLPEAVVTKWYNEDALRYLVFSDGQEYKPVEGLRLDQNRFFKKTLRAR